MARASINFPVHVKTASAIIATLQGAWPANGLENALIVAEPESC
jgi:hypothetical protein